MQDTRRTINAIASTQRGLVTRRDLSSAGVARHQLLALEREGALVRIGQRSFRHGAVAMDDRARVLAASLDTGGAASHRSAAWLHGLDGFVAGSPPEVLVRGRRRDYRASLARVHTTTWLPSDDLIEVDGTRCTSVARTLFNLAALVPELSLDVVRNAVDEAVRRRMASDKWLWWRLEKLRCRGRNGVSAFEAILTDRVDGGATESWLEREFLEVLRSAGVPVPRCQAKICARGALVARVDFLYEDARLVIEVTGAVAHSTPAQRAADARRRNELARAGYFVLEFTYEQVVAEPARVVADVLGALADRQAA